MGGLRRVADDQAGPHALGILVPPGRRTFLILRPRALPWDLLLVRAPGTCQFHDMTAHEATTAAQRLYRALEAWAAGGAGRIDVVASGDDAGSWLQATVGAHALVACPRLPGQPYAAQRFANDDDARAAAVRLAVALRPPEGGERELYFNTRHFAR